MGFDVERFDASHNQVKCRCGAIYEIYQDDGIPGCRDIETVDCTFCGAELAKHFGTCNGTLIDDSNVSKVLKNARQKYDTDVQAYVQKNGYDWGTDEYAAILKLWRDDVKNELKL